jgi:hypothetical protein
VIVSQQNKKLNRVASICDRGSYFSHFSINAWGFLTFDQHQKTKIIPLWPRPVIKLPLLLLCKLFYLSAKECQAIHQAIEYKEENPVRKKSAESPEKYRWLSAYAKMHNEGMVPDEFNVLVKMANPQYQRIGFVG